MTRSSIFKLVATMLVFAALVIVWPALAGTARRPLIGDWVPTEEPGTIVGLQFNGRVEQFALGERFHGISMQCPGPAGYSSLKSQVYEEADGRLGCTGEPSPNNIHSHYQSILSEHTGLSGGYRDKSLMHATLGHDDGVTSSVVLAAPITIQSGTTPWQTLAAVLHLGFAVEWRMTTDALELRRVILPDAIEPKWAGGRMRFVAGSSSVAQEWLGNGVSLPRSIQPFPADGRTNAMVFVGVEPAGISLEVVVQ